MTDNADTTIKDEDLDLVDDALEDEGKDEAALWDEISQDEGEATASDDPDNGSPDNTSGDDDQEWDAAASADDAAKIDDGAATADGKPPSDDGKSGDGKSPDKADGSTQKEDIWAKATPEQRAAFKDAQDKLSRLEQTERSNRGRVSALQRQINDLTRSGKPAASPGAADTDGDASTGVDADKLLASDNWKSFESEYPEVAKPIGEVIRAMRADLDRHNKSLAAIDKERIETDRNEQYDLLIEQHADYDKVIEDPRLGEWLNEQPRHIREAAVRNGDDIVDAAEAADVVSRFKAYIAEQDKANGAGNGSGAENGSGDGASQPGKEATQDLSGKRRRQLASAATARTRSPGVATTGIPEDGDEETLWKQMDEAERRQQRA